MKTNRKPRVIIVGAGLAGLACALRLRTLGYDYTVVESSDDVGGRVRTDIVEDFRLDRGFQVLLEAYPETRRVLDYASLELERFIPGARIFNGSGFDVVADPLRAPEYALNSLVASVGTLGDKLRIPFWSRGLGKESVREIFTSREQSTQQYLQESGFSDQIIERFFRPFLSGIFLESQLNTSSSMAKFVLKMMGSGAVSVPRFGMGAISHQLADRVGRENIRFETVVSEVSSHHIRLNSSETLEADFVVLATDRSNAWKLLGLEEQAKSWTNVSNLYFATSRNASSGRWLLLNGSGKGVVNNVVVMSNLSREYAPKGRHLVSVSVLGTRSPREEEGLSNQVLNELEEWFGGNIKHWDYLRSYHIPHALPSQPSGYFTEQKRPTKWKGIYLAGDYCDSASIHGAMVSGRLAAERIHRGSQKKLK
ncbi:MAG: NAD(P)/FAD-dependent oxidoreductase [Candidatus Sumerlaeia bacterium]|nr:NAD(P)/FAD-dependent oxidoreductase [Candidatus Sumerlaeia bacterium]